MVEELRPREAEQEDRGVAAQVGYVLDEVEEVRLAPVDVVEDDHERLVGCVRLEELAERPGDLVGRAGRGLVAEDRAERRRGAVSPRRGRSCFTTSVTGQ